MGLYNTLRANVRCPRCGRESEMDVDLYFGWKGMLEFHLGDEYRWSPKGNVEAGGRPEGGNLDGEGYVECPQCGKDFFARVRVRNDVLEGVEPDPRRTPLIPDD